MSTSSSSAVRRSSSPAAPARRSTRRRLSDAVSDDACELCKPDMVLIEDERAYVRYDNNSLARGHVLVVPRRHVASFFDMTSAEKMRVIELLDRAKAHIEAE